MASEEAKKRAAKKYRESPKGKAAAAKRSKRYYDAKLKGQRLAKRDAQPKKQRGRPAEEHIFPTPPTYVSGGVDAIYGFPLGSGHKEKWVGPKPRSAHPVRGKYVPPVKMLG